MTLNSQSLNLNARQILFKRLSTAQSLVYTGPLGEIIIDANLKLLRVQDGVTAGGHLMVTDNVTANLQSQIDFIKSNLDPAAIDSLTEIMANVNALLANNAESQLINSGFYANLTTTGNLILDGSLLPKNHLTQDLGSASKAWRNLYISNATAYFGNAALTVTNNGLQVFNSNNQLMPLIGNVKFPDGTIQLTAVDQEIVANIFYLLTPNVSANLNAIHTDVTNAISYFGNLANAAVTTVQANLQSQIDFIKTNIDPAALDSLTEIVASFQNIDANIVSNIGTLGNIVGNLVATQDRLTSGNAQVVLNTSGPEPYVLFPAASDGQQLQLSQAEISSIAGNLALTSAEDAYVITNGSGAAPGGAKNWKFDQGGNLTLPNNAVIKDTATNSISFGLRAGDSGQGSLTVAIGSQAGEINQGLQSTAVGSYAGNYNQGIGTVAIGTNAGAFNQGLRAVAIGGLAGAQNQGEYAVALGNFAGGTDQPNNSIIINASGTALNGSASGLFIDPVREVVGTKIVYYNSSTKEITTGPIGLTSNSNVSITSNNNVWTFGTDGSMTTPGLLKTGNIQVGRNIYGSAFYGISNAIQLRPDIDIDKRFLFTVDSSGGNYIRSGMEMPMAEVDKAVTLAFPHDNSTAGYIFNQGTDTNGTEWNDALVIFQNGGNVKIGTITGVNGNKVWEFNQTGNLTLPQTAMDVSPAPVSWPGITFSDGTFQNTAYTGGGGAASTVNVTDTNGLTTTYYPTFVESRTTGQYVRADVDLTYRTDTNLLKSGNIQVGRNIYGSPLGGISDGIQLRPNISIDKRFLFTVDSGGGNYLRSGMEMPMAEVNKAVTLGFPHNNGHVGYIYSQGSDANGTEFNNAFNIMSNGVDLKLSAFNSNDKYVWTFDVKGNITLPQTNMNASPAPVSLPGITFTDGTFQTTAYTGAAATVDILNTNNLSNTFYPTFVEFRTTGQYVRADVDFIYRSDSNTLTVPKIAGILQGNVDHAGGYINFTGSPAPGTSGITFADATTQTTAWTKSAAQVQSTPPASPVTGQLYYDTDDGRTYIYTGAAWIDANPAGGGGSAALDEAFGNLTAATGVVTHDCTTNRLFYHTSMSANFTANFTNLNLSAGRSTSISLVLVQGGTARMVTAVQIGGVAQTITWQGSASAPAGNANRTDAVTFSILNVGGTYTVLGMMTSFGGV